MKAMISWFAQNSVVANLLLAVIVATGAITLTDLKKEIFPEFSLDLITITMDYRGAAPEEVEEAICVRIEESIQGLDGIKKVTSTAREGSGGINIEVMAGYEVRKVLEDVKTRVTAIDTFPDEADQPIIQEVTSRFQVINIAISGDADLATLKSIAERTRDELTALPTISQVDLLNAPPYEISIEVSEEALRRWGLTFDQIANAVRRFSVDLPGGSVKTGTGEILLRTKGQAYTGSEYEQLPLLTRPDGTRIYLRDVARVVDGFEEISQSAMLNGKPSVNLQVYRVGDQSAVTVAESVYEYLEEAATRVPDVIEIATWQDSARLLKGRIDLLVRNALTGLVLVFVVLTLFLRLRLAFWITIGIPVSFLGAIALMPVFDVSINMISLFSFILVLGIVVDDAIVVGENIHTMQVRTGKGLLGSVEGTHEVLVPVTFGVLTTMAAFSPMLFVPGIMGKIMFVFPMIILPTLFFSLVESKLILPCHLRHYSKPEQPQRLHAAVRGWNGFLDLFANALNWYIRRVYRPVLAVALRWRYLTLATALVSVLVTAGMVGGGFVRMVLFPTVESDSVVAFLTMPQEAPPAVTAEGVRRITQEAFELRQEIAAEVGEDQFKTILSSVGEHPYKVVQSGPASAANVFQGDHLGEVNIELQPSETRVVTAEEIAARWRARVGQIPGAVELTINYDLIGSGKAINIQFSAFDLAKVRAVAERTKTRLARYPGVIEITDSYRGGKPEIKLALTSEGEALGLTLQNLGNQVRQGFFGEEAQRIQRGRDDIRVMVRYPEQARKSLGDLERMRVRTPGGAEVPFSTVAVATLGRGPAAITRVDRNRAISVEAEVDEAITSGSEVTAALEADFLPELLAEYSGVTYSLEGDQADWAESMAGLTKGFGITMFVMFAMLAIPLKSYIKPAIILSAVPFGMVGAVWGHAILGKEVSFMSMCGMVALAGVVVNDGLVLVSFINNYRAQHKSMSDAVLAAGQARFRAILLTSLTTAAGVTPLMLEKSLQAQFLIPMAVALAFGVLFATVVTLVLVPALYLILEDLQAVARWLIRGERRIAAPVPGAEPEGALGD